MLRPINHLNTASKLYPGAWKQVDIFRQSRGVDLPEWPAWCFMPLAAWYAIVSADAGVNRLPIHLIGDVARLAALGTWRYSQGIYRFDPDAAAAMTGTVLHGEMPTDVLLRLPEWCVYVEMPSDYRWDNDRLYGFWAHLEWDANTHRRELRLLLDTEEALIPQILHLGPWTVTEAVDRWFGEAEKQAAIHKIEAPFEMRSAAVEHYGAAINPLLSMLLYLCSDEPEISDRQQPEARPSRPTPTRTKKGWRLFPPAKPKLWTVGGEIGEQLRKAQTDNTGKTGRTVKTHLRRGHWHGYWTGPRSGERRFIYKWMPPIVVAGGNDDENS